MPDDALFGFLNIDKPLGLTSHDVVAKVRRKFKLKRVGHAGTLDPLATGVLIVCLGGATRLSENVMHSTKQYRARVKLGETTTTYDAEGEVVRQRDAAHITRAMVDAVLPQYTGEIDQLPPMYSAIKKGGRKLYEIARAGETVELTPRRITIHGLAIVEWSPPEFVLDVTCSVGTYIRSLAYDIGEALGVGAYLSGLTRTASGSFRVEQAVTLERLLESDAPEQFLIAPKDALAQFSTLIVDADAVEHIRRGRAIPHTGVPDDTEAFAYTQDGQFVAVLRSEGGLWKPHKVFIT